MTLRLLGFIYTVTKSSLVIVKIEDPNRIPKINDQVFDVNNEFVGTVVDIIGPVSSPFAVLKPVNPQNLSLLKPSAPLFYKFKKSKEMKRGG